MALQRDFKAMTGTGDFMNFTFYILLLQFVIQGYSLVTKRVVLGNLNIGWRNALE